MAAKPKSNPRGYLTTPRGYLILVISGAGFALQIDIATRTGTTYIRCELLGTSYRVGVGTMSRRSLRSTGRPFRVACSPWSKNKTQQVSAGSRVSPLPSIVLRRISSSTRGHESYIALCDRLHLPPLHTVTPCVRLMVWQ